MSKTVNAIPEGFHSLALGTHKEDLTPGELERRAEEAFTQWAAGEGAGA